MSGDFLDGATPSFPGLPIELILTILEHALQAAPNQPYANFQKFSLICRVFIVLSLLPIEYPFHLLVCSHGGQLLNTSFFVPYACTRLNASRNSFMRPHRTILCLQRVALGIGSTLLSTTWELPRAKPSFLMFFVTVQTCMS